MERIVSYNELLDKAEKYKKYIEIKLLSTKIYLL